jgi:hypothetical protein
MNSVHDSNGINTTSRWIGLWNREIEFALVLIHFMKGGIVADDRGRPLSRSYLAAATTVQCITNVGLAQISILSFEPQYNGNPHTETSCPLLGCR